MARDEWRINYLGLFLSVSGIIAVVTCALIAYSAVDFTESKLAGDAVAESTLPAPTITINPSSTTSTSTTTTTLAIDFDERNRQDFINVVDTLMNRTLVKLTVFNNALDAEDDDTTQRLAGELAVLWNSAPPIALGDVPWEAEYEEARNTVGNTFLALYDALERRSRGDTADAKTQVQVVAIPLIEHLEEAIGP